MLKLEDFITEKTLKPFIEERRTAYEDKAIGFLRQEFEPALRLLDDDQLRKVVQLAYENARKRNITTEREHLKYLIPVMFWGSYFETDPQYRTELTKAGWLNEHGHFFDHVYMPRLLSEIDRRTLYVAPDLASYRRVMSGLREIYTEPLPAKITPYTLSKIMEYIWPESFKLSGRNNCLALAEIGVNRGENLSLETRDIIAYVCLSVYFGYAFDECPKFPWAVSALANDGRAIDKRRTALWQGVTEYFDTFIENK